MIKANYEDCITNLACSIRKYFEVEYKHNTIKEVDEEGFVKNTPDRRTLWQVQTPQIFRYDEIKKAHELVMEREDINITDDAFVYECAFHKPIELVMGSYENIKITTPEDMDIAQTFLKRRRRKEALKPFGI